MSHKILSDPNKIRRNPWYRNPIRSCGTSENIGILQIRSELQLIQYFPDTYNFRLDSCTKDSDKNNRIPIGYNQIRQFSMVNPTGSDSRIFRPGYVSKQGLDSSVVFKQIHCYFFFFVL